MYRVEFVELDNKVPFKEFICSLDKVEVAKVFASIDKFIDLKNNNLPIKENLSKKLDDDTKKQVMPLLDAILQAQPTIRVKSYAQTNISITMPKNRYEKMGRPQVGDKLQIDLKKI